MSEFYIQNNTKYLGNAPLWWRPNGKGYTFKIEEAGLYDKSDAVSQNKCRAEDIPWPKGYMDNVSVKNDVQYMNIKKALKGTGIKLHREKPIPRDKYKCESCGRFCSLVGYCESSCCNKNAVLIN